MCYLLGSSTKRNSSFLLFGTSPYLLGMLQAQIAGMPSLQARLQESSSFEESFGRKTDFTTGLVKFANVK
jgi:hypothetical protein